MHAFSRREGMAVDSLSFLPSLSPHLRSPFRVAEVKEESSEPRTAREGGRDEGAAKQHDGNCRSRTGLDGPHRFISGHAD